MFTILTLSFCCIACHGVRHRRFACYFYRFAGNHTNYIVRMNLFRFAKCATVVERAIESSCVLFMCTHQNVWHELLTIKYVELMWCNLNGWMKSMKKYRSPRIRSRMWQKARARASSHTIASLSWTAQRALNLICMFIFTPRRLNPFFIYSVRLAEQSICRSPCTKTNKQQQRQQQLFQLTWRSYFSLLFLSSNIDKYKTVCRCIYFSFTLIQFSRLLLLLLIPRDSIPLTFSLFIKYLNAGKINIDKNAQTFGFYFAYAHRFYRPFYDLINFYIDKTNNRMKWNCNKTDFFCSEEEMCRLKELSCRSSPQVKWKWQ